MIKSFSILSSFLLSLYLFTIPIKATDLPSMRPFKKTPSVEYMYLNTGYKSVEDVVLQFENNNKVHVKTPQKLPKDFTNAFGKTSEERIILEYTNPTHSKLIKLIISKEKIHEFPSDNFKQTKINNGKILYYSFRPNANVAYFKDKDLHYHMIIPTIPSKKNEAPEHNLNQIKEIVNNFKQITK
ncbi:DUF4367 domain-containing protein [Campylobacter jejuni]